ncbi:MAG: hypothetical protein ACREBU_04500 [Nitrososphaera sp.]
MRKYASEAFLVGLALLISATAVSAYAQPVPPAMEEVSGTYQNTELGVEITFPEGWEGFSIASEEGTFVSVQPGGMGESEDVVTAMMLIISDKSGVEEAPTDPSDFSQDDQAPDCSAPSFAPRTVSGVTAMEATIECTHSDGQAYKMKIVGAETQTRWIVVGYTALSSEFDSNVGAFDSAVNSLTLQGAINTSMPPAGTGTEDGAEPSMMSVMVAGAEVEVEVESSSQISEFELDEASKTLSFKSDGSGTETVVMVGTVLEGPYTVMVDGQATQVEEGQDGGVSTITVPHSSGAHEITITGTQVVPEFPFAAVGIAAALIGIVTVIGRTKLIKGRI